MHFGFVRELIEKAETESCSIGEVVKKEEARSGEKSVAAIEDEMYTRWEIMVESFSKGLAIKQKSMGGLVGENGILLEEYRKKGKSLSGDLLCKAAARAMAAAETNAAMGRIVASPTAGSCGIIPGTLSAVAENLESSKEEIVNALFAASGIGLVIGRKASLAGATGGCQAECGSAAAMVAAAIVELAGGTPAQAGEAVALVLKNILGLVCDPVGGLVEVPCVKRNAAGAALALLGSELALAGIKSIIPVDEVIAVMGEVGKSLPVSLRETSRGGLAVSPTGLRLKSELMNNTLK